MTLYNFFKKIFSKSEKVKAEEVKVKEIEKVKPNELIGTSYRRKRQKNVHKTNNNYSSRHQFYTGPGFVGFTVGMGTGFRL